VRSWKVSLAACSVAQFLCLSGLTAGFSFFPFYIRELGVTDTHEVELWAGFLTSSGRIAMALALPVWGMLADRYGRKAMVQATAFGGALPIGLMAVAGNVQQLLALRILYGLLAGTVPTFMALVSSFAPAGETAFALGMMQMAYYTGMSAGPLIGGLIADHFGYRSVFFVTSLMPVVAGLLVMLVVKERSVIRARSADQRSLKDTLGRILRSRPLIGGLLCLALFHFASSSLIPIMPLYVESLLQDSTMLNTSAGSVLAVKAVTSAIAAAFFGRLADRRGQRRILLVVCIGASVMFAGQAAAPSYVVLLVASTITGFFTGGLIPTANAILARMAPRQREGTLYGVSSSINAVAQGVSPLVGVAIAGAWGYRITIGVTAGFFLLNALWVTIMVQPQPAERTETT
jgi:DHA1 family multidrug resistance protein-like MFS transporter